MQEGMNGIVDPMTRDSQPYKSGLYDEFFDAASTNQLSMEEAVAYSQSYYKEIENQSAVEFAAKKAAKKAYSEGEEKGLEKGLEKGREEERIKNIEAARKAGLSDDMIAKIFA